MRKGQASFEFLLVTGIAITLLLASTYFIFGYTQSGAERTAMAQASQIGYQMVDNSRKAYIHGEGSFFTILANLPDQARQVYVTEENTLVIELETSKGTIPIHIFSDIPINGTTSDGDKVHVNTNAQTVRPGRVSYKVESQGNWVRISQR